MRRSTTTPCILNVAACKQAEYSNPIKQDIKKGELRHYHDAIPYNYGMLPQTWEDPAASSSVLPGIGGTFSYPQHLSTRMEIALLGILPNLFRTCKADICFTACRPQLRAAALSLVGCRLARMFHDQAAAPCKGCPDLRSMITVGLPSLSQTNTQRLGLGERIASWRGPGSQATRVQADVDATVHCRATMIQWMWWRSVGAPCRAVGCTMSSSWARMR